MGPVCDKFILYQSELQTTAHSSEWLNNQHGIVMSLREDPVDETKTLKPRLRVYFLGFCFPT